MLFESTLGMLSPEPPPDNEPVRRPVERIKKTLRKYTSKLQLRRASASTDEPAWDSVFADDASDPPRYSRLRMLDDYRWPVCEPLEVLVLSNEHSSTPRRFSCQVMTIPTRAAAAASSSLSSSCLDDREESLDRLITLPCGHIYHPACLQSELRRHAYARCPRCQHTLHYRLCHHRVHIPYFAPGTAIHPDELDGACRCCAPFPFMQHVMAERGEGAQSGDGMLSAILSSTTTKDKDHGHNNNNNNNGHKGQQPSADVGGFSVSKDEDAGAADFGWHWWALSVFEGGAERFLAERAALQRRLLRVCAGGHERERRVAVLILDTLWLVYAHLRAHKGLEWPHALRLVGPIAYEEAAASCCRTAEQRGVDVWAGLLDMMVERMHFLPHKAFHLRGATLWQPYELIPFQPYYPMVEDLTDGAV
ncbi:hypothetical protein PFICI_06760 [Pestalotiopsis fici W106-1]|uniref:RING-type domain-containing protein n=1 Tax=Pestalotiopsis fici (strain W106-1 / CGMCC3.15140) TaxID=1229662 RepID=W3X6N3_PESFW|nr:uncharacterized protein PFICI_06760 [Pestalotiopsis fici W106-1]ETS81758.1 hypothetical protein PFICI_06760 [Pestalotiopsis fici W106-1]